jgi:hypothetical protein
VQHTKHVEASDAHQSFISRTNQTVPETTDSTAVTQQRPITILGHSSGQNNKWSINKRDKHIHRAHIHSPIEINAVVDPNISNTFQHIPAARKKKWLVVDDGPILFCLLRK